ncbi:MAG TPA: ATP-binding protein [Candidatus Bathyarchaeia archaeon]
MADPRTSIISERLARITRIIAVSSGKGGVGKSMVATTLALILSKEGCKVGLFDLDFTSPSTHTILGARNAQPTEDKGLIPPSINGLDYMSLIYYTNDQSAPLRGTDTSNALIELLAVTRWGQLDYLILDMPPGIGDAVLDLIRFVKCVEFIIVTTPSQLAFKTVEKLSSLLKDLEVPIVGVVENMKMDQGDIIRQKTEKLGLDFLGGISYDPNIEHAIGNPEALLNTAIAQRTQEIAKMLQAQ